MITVGQTVTRLPLHAIIGVRIGIAVEIEILIEIKIKQLQPFPIPLSLAARERLPYYIPTYAAQYVEGFSLHTYNYKSFISNNMP